ncbi:hypothetical protein DPMN_027506 [Dreissena polymorpha]|uniref:Uncharacterized protein n=1 Tax=Dreissena polymorpha TaxID=45954 RepID=A0A9D4LTL5_DREPO|nr:hypothetical protein DPMN_041134 [Dreissena polymorpha]KAH3864488.1 hypothetical protein DPMN_027506 [Dreissena polymorpha]
MIGIHEVLSLLTADDDKIAPVASMCVKLARRSTFDISSTFKLPNAELARHSSSTFSSTFGDNVVQYFLNDELARHSSSTFSSTYGESVVQ